ncbi:hypothetical protein [Brassicibacter mesophilus]|uniref:hypothetical protein n=1 Tax=Brassicibacter mesophilus TaxID=745119 RepID=UPI003D1F8C69
MNVDIKVIPNLRTLMMQGIGTLALVGVFVLFFYIIFILIKLPKKIVTLENKVKTIDETIKRMENTITKNKE